MRVELTMADLQSAALATWLQPRVYLQPRKPVTTGQVVTATTATYPEAACIVSAGAGVGIELKRPHGSKPHGEARDSLRNACLPQLAGEDAAAP